MKVKLETRKTKPGRDKLLTALKKKIALNKPRNSNEYNSPNGNDVEYWLDHAEWTVIPTPIQLELSCTKIILQSAQDQGIYLNSNGDDERILYSLLANLTKKSATSRVLHSAADKSYHRTNFVPWFNAEIEYYSSLGSKHVKVYTTNKNNLNFYTQYK